MALSVTPLAAMPGRLPTHPLFSHLPGFAIFGVGMLAGALAVAVSGWLSEHARAGRPRPARPSSLTQFMLTAPLVATSGLPAGRTALAPRLAREVPAPAPRLAAVPD